MTHKEYIRSLPSIASSEEYQIECHHVRTYWNSSMSKKPDDKYSLPLTLFEHDRLHRIGEDSFWEEHNINPFEMILKILHEKP